MIWYMEEGQFAKPLIDMKWHSPTRVTPEEKVQLLGAVLLKSLDDILTAACTRTYRVQNACMPRPHDSTPITS